MKAAAKPVPVLSAALEDMALPAFFCSAGGHVLHGNEEAASVFASLKLKKPYLLSTLESSAHAEIWQAFARAGKTHQRIKLMRGSGECWWFSPREDGILVIVVPPHADESLALTPTLSMHVSAALAHEIRNPLLSIASAASLLSSSLTQENDRTLARLIQREAARIEALMLTLDPLSPSPEHTRERINIHEVLEQSIASVQAIFPALILIKDYDPSIPDLKMDSARMTQVFVNLLRNSAEAMSGNASGRITLATRIKQQPQRMLIVSVSDEGCGFSDDVRGKLFVPFSSTKTNGKGLGLSIAQAIVHQHGGTVLAENSATGGAVFTVQLPFK